MKKEYIAPTTSVFAIEPLQMLAASTISVQMKDSEVDANSSFSAGRGWSSDSWSEE